MNCIKRYKRSIFAVMHVGLLAGVTTFLWAQDIEIAVNPTYIFFADQTPGSQSNAATISLKNVAYVSGVNVGSISKIGLNADDFLLSADDCSGQTLSNVDDTCNLQVRFAPQSSGVKAALIHIPYGSSDAELSVYLSNREDVRHEVERRMTPVIYALSVPEQMEATQSYDLNWTTLGYHSDYKTRVVMFDCTGIADFDCGAEYGTSNMFYDSGALTPLSEEASDWTYSSERASNYLYGQSLNIAEYRPGDQEWGPSGTSVVIRFYVISESDSLLGKPSLSMIIPGGLASDYYDTSGRKLRVTVCPSGGCI